MEENVAQQAPSAPEKPDAYMTVAPERRLPVPEAASAELSWSVGDERIDYTATAAHIDVRTDTGALIGKMFSVSYVAKGGDGPRPVTFCYNGGPGSSSVPINVGGIGPRRVVTDGVEHIAAPFEVEDNPGTLLPVTDLVFLDALGTGYSALAEGVDTGKVWSIDGDADAFVRAIVAWLDTHDRWSSPVYLFGESYGTIRNAVLMRLLGEKRVQLKGVVMLSALFDTVQTLPGEDLYYLGMLPTYAATAQFFGRAGRGVDEDAWFDRAMAFTEDVYAPALLRGDRLSERELASVAKKMSKLIGVDASFIARRHLRVDLDAFRRELLADEGRVVGRLDMRFSSAAPADIQGSDFFMGEDAASDAAESAWATAFRDHLRHDIGYRGAPIYLPNNYGQVGGSWDWSHEVPGYGKVSMPNVALDIATAMRRNPTVRVAIVGGRFDAATTYWNVEHDIAGQFLSPELRERVEFLRYGCGHMAYTDVPTLHAMAADMREFYAR